MGQVIRIDCRGLQCPQPVLQAKEALERSGVGAVEVLVDNEASRGNVERFARSQGYSSVVTEEGGLFRITISRSGDTSPPAGDVDVSAYTCAPAAGELICIVPSDVMGRGNDELGRVLMRAYIKTIREVTPLPAKIFFFNTGVTITASQSDLIEPLREIEAKGVEIFSCGTCLDFLGLKERLLVGKTTNMHEIMQSMASAARIVSPC